MPRERERMKVFNTSFTLSSEEGTEVTDITKLVREAIQQFPVSAGIALINTLHTTCAVFINEFQSALIDDLKGLVEKLVPERHGYRHDDPRFSDCERGNAHSHLRQRRRGLGVTPRATTQGIAGVYTRALEVARFESFGFSPGAGKIEPTPIKTSLPAVGTAEIVAPYHGNPQARQAYRRVLTV